MTLQEFLDSPHPLYVLAGVAGAAAMATTDWRSPRRALQHLLVGTVTSIFATPVFAPGISSLLGWAHVDPAAHPNASAFIVGAVGIYVLEYILAFMRAKTKKPLSGNPGVPTNQFPTDDGEEV